jgi:hypothetical protein
MVDLTCIGPRERKQQKWLLRVMHTALRGEASHGNYLIEYEDMHFEQTLTFQLLL